MQFRILGPLEAIAEGRVLAIPSRQQRALLALLVVNANRVLSPDRIVDAIWGDELPGSGTKALAFHVSRLRDALAPGRRPGSPAGGIETQSGGYLLRVDPDAIDAVRFERLARDAHVRLADDPEAARSILVEALGLWRGDALVDVAYADFAQEEIRRLDELRLEALEDRLEAELGLGGHLGAVAELEALLATNPLRERLRFLTMLALYRSGRQAEALRVAGTGRRLLSEELGIDPSPDLARLEAQILAQDPALDPPRAAGPGSRLARNPYKGLRAFSEADSADFFGREALVSRLLARVDEVAHGGRVLVVVGPSGSGKSSVVRAGLVRALRAGAGDGSARWRIATMVPGAAPFRELAAGLRGSGHGIAASAIERAEQTGDLTPLLAGPIADDDAGLLLVIDQLEELFVRVDEGTRSRFLRGLVAALAAPGTPLVVVATLRADFLHLPLALADVGELVRTGTELVTPLTGAELGRAIVRPAEAVGVDVEPGLVAEMVNDVEQRPGALPLLQFALTELFDRGDGRRLTRDGYAAIGRATGALGRRADEAWRSLDAEGREIAKQVLLGLVALADGGVATTRRVARGDLASLADDPVRVNEVLDDLGRRGLLTFDLDRVTGVPTVVIAHEALLVHWSRLADWIEDLREDLWMRRRLADAADEWDAAGRSPAFLSTGAKLDRFEAWARGTTLHLTETQRAHLAASADERERLARQEAERVMRERRLERRASTSRRVLAAVLVAAVVLAGGLSAALLGERQASVEQEAVASARALANASVASLGKGRQLSVLLALEAANTTVTHGYVVEDAYDALQWALQEAQVPYPAGQVPIGVGSAPSGSRGVFLVAPDVLMRLGIDYVRRFHGSLTPDQCRTYLHAGSCPPIEPPATSVSVGVRTKGGVVVPAAALATDALAETHVSVLSELPADISQLMTPFERGSGVTVDWDPAVGGDLETRIKAHLEVGAAAPDLPDIAIVSRPSYVALAAHDGWLLDIGNLVDTTPVGTEAGQYAMGLGRVVGASPGGTAGQYGVPLAASVDDLLWYPAGAFAKAGYTAPTTTDELGRLIATMRVAGSTPWCLGMEAGVRSGSAAAAWVEDLYLDGQGPAAYDSWVRGDIRFETTGVGDAYRAFASFVTSQGAVLGGLTSAELTSEGIAAWPMLVSSFPRCWLYRGASTDLASFRFSGASPAAAVAFPGGSSGRGPVLGRLYMIVVLHDRPEVRRLVETLLGADFASGMATRLDDVGVFPIRQAPLAVGGVLADQAGRLRAALGSGTFRVRAADLFPETVASAFLQGMSEGLTPISPGWDETLTPLANALWQADLAWAGVRALSSP